MGWYNEGDDDFEWSSTCTASHVQPVPLTPSPPSLSLYVRLLEACDSSVRIEERQMLHTDADFSWSDQEPDSEEDSGPTGNEGVTVDRSYRRAAILLVRTDRRWSFLTQACDTPSIVDELRDVSSEVTAVELEQCVTLATDLGSSLLPHQLPAYLLTLTKLRSVIDDQPASSTCADLSERLLPLMNATLQRTSFDFRDPSTPAQLDRLASASGIDWVAPLLVSAFNSHLMESTESQPGYSGSHVTLMEAANFLLRFFFLHPAAAASSSSPTSLSAASPPL